MTFEKLCGVLIASAVGVALFYGPGARVAPNTGWLSDKPSVVAPYVDGNGVLVCPRGLLLGSGYGIGFPSVGVPTSPTTGVLLWCGKGIATGGPVVTFTETPAPTPTPTPAPAPGGWPAPSVNFGPWTLCEDGDGMLVIMHGGKTRFVFRQNGVLMVNDLELHDALGK